MTYYRRLDDEQTRMPEPNLDPPEYREFTERELAAARDDLLETFVTLGKKWGNWHLWDFLELEIDKNPRFAQELAEVNGGLYVFHGSTYTLAMDKFYRAIVTKHLTDDLIRERAEEIEADSDDRGEE